ncbi:MAG: flippase-like domain-containing protein [Gammaproteobacteria bacterium]|nr:flippase-like domain-containing protein [Gammaproteobacteria bacterium]
MHSTFGQGPAALRHNAEFYLIRLIGEAYNNALPLASVGGEPIKAKLLRDHLGIDYTQSGVAFLVAKTANLIALVIFLAAGFAFMLADPRFSTAYRTVAGLGLAFFAVSILLMAVVQQARTAPLFERLTARRAEHPRVAKALAGLAQFDDQLAACYRGAPRRFVGIVLLALVTWLAGIVEIWIILAAADNPVTLQEAWVVEAAVQLVRTAAFFIPSGLGVVDGSFVLVVGIVTGSQSLGVLVAVVRRARDLLWIAAGFVAGLRYVGRSGLSRLWREGSREAG